MDDYEYEKEREEYEHELIESLEEEQEARGFYAFQDLMDIYHTER